MTARSPASSRSGTASICLAPVVLSRASAALVAMVSRSADAELNALVVEKFGIEAVRGSGGRDSSRHLDKGGARALIALKKALDAGKNVAMIADIPHGTPARCRHGHRPARPAFGPSDRRRRHRHQPPQGAGEELGQDDDQPAVRPLRGRRRRTRSCVAKDADEAEMERKRQELTDGAERGDRRGLRARRRCAMSERWARTVLSATGWRAPPPIRWSGPTSPGAPRKGKEDRSRRRERYGFAGKPRPDGPLIWVHAASVGETIAVVPAGRDASSISASMSC